MIPTCHACRYNTNYKGRSVCLNFDVRKRYSTVFGHNYIPGVVIEKLAYPICREFKGKLVVKK